MPEYPNPAGGSMTAANDADAASKGWSPSMGTFGSNTYPNGQGGSPSTPSSPGSADLSGYVAAMQASSGFSVKQLDEQKREFDATLDWQKQQWAQQGLPQLAIQQRAQDLEDQKFAELQRSALVSENLAQQGQDLQKQVQLGNLSIAQAQEQLQEFVQKGQLAVSQGQLGVAQGQLGVSQGQLGLDTLKTAASLSGPENWIQASNFTRGVAGNAQLPGFLNQLLSGQSTATLGGATPGMQQSNPLTMQGMASAMGAPQTTPSPMLAPGQPGQPGAPMPQQMQTQGPGANTMQTMQMPQFAQMTPEQQQQMQTQIQQLTAQKQAMAGAPQPQAPGQMMTYDQTMQTQGPGANTPPAPNMQWQSGQYSPDLMQQRYQQAQNAMGGSGGVQTMPQAGTAPPQGFWTTIANGQQVYTPTTGAPGGAAAATQGQQNIMGNQYMQAQGPGANTQQASAPGWATTQDVANMFGRSNPYQAGAQQPQQGFGQDTTQAQNAMSKIFAAGGQSLAPQQLEGMTSSERSMFEGGGKAIGADVAGFEDQYARSRIGQSAAKPQSFSGM